MTLRTLLQSASRELTQAGLEEPRREARLLLAHALGVAPSMLLDEDRELSEPVAFASLVARRVRREPLARITGRRGFWTLDLAVSADTLIPRPDSETLIEAALLALPEPHAPLAVLDLGTGTGCLLLAFLAERPRAWGLGIDRSVGAARLAAANASANGLAERSTFLVADWAAPLGGRFDLVLANPPYIPGGDIAGLMPEVALYEPGSALDGGADGLDAYRSLARALPGLLAPDGIAILELGQGQAPAVCGLMSEAGLDVQGLRADLNDIERALLLQAGPSKKQFGKPVSLG